MFFLTLVGCGGVTAKSHYILAEKLWTDRNYSAAVVEFEKVITKDPNGKLGVQALFRAAMTQSLFLEKYQEALSNLRRFIELSSNPALTWEAQVHVGEILFSKTEQYDLAISHYRTLLKTRPGAAETPEFLFRIARSQFFLWQFDGALQGFRDLHFKFPEHPLGERAAFEIGVVQFTRGEQRPGPNAPSPQKKAVSPYQEAIRSYEGFIKKYPKSRFVPEARFGIAACFEEMDQLDAAYQKYEELRHLYPSRNVVEIKLARIRERKAQRSH